MTTVVSSHSAIKAKEESRESLVKKLKNDADSHAQIHRHAMGILET